MRSTHLLFLVLSLTLISFPKTAYAQALSDSGTNFLTALQNLLTNTWARIIAIIGLGILWMTGRLSWGVAASINISTCLFLFVLISAPALAQSSDLAPITNLTDFILDFLTGPFARSIAGIAVVALGIMAKAGRLKWQHAASVIFGIALVFGGATIADQLANAAG